MDLHALRSAGDQVGRLRRVQMEAALGHHYNSDSPSCAEVRFGLGLGLRLRLGASRHRGGSPCPSPTPSEGSLPLPLLPCPRRGAGRYGRPRLPPRHGRRGRRLRPPRGRLRHAARLPRQRDHVREHPPSGGRPLLCTQGQHARWARLTSSQSSHPGAPHPNGCACACTYFLTSSSRVQLFVRACHPSRPGQRARAGAVRRP